MSSQATRVVQAYADSDETLHCMRCNHSLDVTDVAMFIRSDPSDAFNAWCPRCALWILKLAADQLDGGWAALLF